MRALIFAFSAGCYAPLVTTGAGLRTEALPMPEGGPPEVTATGAYDYRIDADYLGPHNGAGSVNARFRAGATGSVQAFLGGGRTDLFHFGVVAFNTWPRDPSAPVHGGLHGGFLFTVTGSLRDADGEVMLPTPIGSLLFGAHLHTRITPGFRWTLGGRVEGLPGLYLMLTGATGPAFRFPSGGRIQPMIMVEGTITTCAVGQCAGWAPGVRLTLGYAPVDRVAPADDPAPADAVISPP